MRVTIGIPTRDRAPALARLLASLHAQTYKLWDLVIVNDSSGPMLDNAGDEILKFIEASGHQVRITRGSRINQAYNHNHVLWSADAHRLILRLDDDMILTPSYLDILVNAYHTLKDHDQSVAAVSGVIFTEHLMPRHEYPPIPTGNAGSTKVGMRGDDLSAFTFMREYSDDTPIEAEHLYSSCLYERDAMRRVGGWPMVYSRGVSYHEETDGTYRLHLAGYKLYLIPGAKAVHSHEGVGGTRLMSSAEHNRRREKDWADFQLRLGRLRGINWQPSVAVCSQHCGRIGGGERLTYELVSVLQDMVDDGVLKCVHLFPVNDETVLPPEFVREHFSGASRFSYENIGEDIEQEYDVVISIGHTPPALGEIPPRSHHIHYSLYPMVRDFTSLPRGVDRIVGISNFTSNAIRLAYHRSAETIYPFVQELDRVSSAGIEKDKVILLIGRLHGEKGIVDLANAFMKMDLPDAVMKIVVPGQDSHVKKIINHERIKIYSDVSAEELLGLYREAAVLWAGRGWQVEQSTQPEIDREHFGYTPVEALSCLCVPVAFDAGGYRETTYARWSNLKELENITKMLLEDQEFWQKTLITNLEQTRLFMRETFSLNWARVVLSLNACAWTQEIEWRQSDDDIDRVDVHGKSSIALFSDHPMLKTGYGVICSMLADGLQKHFDTHVLGINGPWPDIEQRYTSLWPHHTDVGIKDAVKELLSHQVCNCVVVAYDPFISGQMIRAIRAINRHIPIVAFVSQEGFPAHNSWADILTHASRVLTYSHSAKNAILQRFGITKSIEVARLGLDHAPFERYPDEIRNQLRQIAGWDNLFVIMSVGANRSNKGFGRLMKSVAILMNKYDRRDLLLALHTDMTPDRRFGGIDIGMYASMIGLDGSNGAARIAVTRMGSGIDYGPHYEHVLRGGMPVSARDQDRKLRSLGLIDLYNMADLYVDVSSAEGFGIPYLEAMACGVPVLTINDRYVRAEITQNHPSLIPGALADVWVNGADLIIAHPEIVAERINQFMDGNPDSAIAGRDADKIVSKLKWQEAQEKVIEAVRQCLR